MYYPGEGQLINGVPRGCCAIRVATAGKGVPGNISHEKGLTMQEENRSILGSLNQNIEELIPPIDAAQAESVEEESGTRQPGIDLLMSDLTMMVVLLTNVDSEISAQELNLINGMRHVVYGDGIPEFTSDDYLGLFRELLQLYPTKRLTLDYVPASIRLLKTYDQTHGTDYAGKAKGLFIQFGEAIVRADKQEDFVENIHLTNFKDVLNAV